MIQFIKQGRFLALMFMLLGCLAIQASDDLITKQITIKLDKAGTLPDKIGSTKKYKITNLKIVGEINGTDWVFIRDMAGRGLKDYIYTNGKLSVLDLSEAKIVEGGDCYYYDVTKYYTSNDRLGDYAFYGCCRLTSLSLPSGITSIGNYAFQDCWGLTSFVIPSKVTTIGVYAFYGCSGLTSLDIPSSVTSIHMYAFAYCSGLTNLVIPSGVTTIAGYAFYGCSGLTNLVIPSGVTTIVLNAFSGCSGLTSLNIPSSVTSIGESTFSGCSGLTSLVIPSGVTSIEKSTFRGCSGLTSLVIPSGVTSIGESAFSDCSGLTSLVIPSGVTSIEKSTFSGCSGLTSFVIPSSVTSIGESAFSGCSGLTSVYVSWQTPLRITTSVFSHVDKTKCTLYVPQGASQDYWLADVWGDFENIVEYDVTGIDNVATSTDAKEISRYSANGQRLSAPTKGLNIVKYSDGSVKKVVVQ